MTATTQLPPLIARGNLVLLPTATETVVAPRRHRSYWRKPWWWRPLRYWLSPSYTSKSARIRALEKAYGELWDILTGPGGVTA